MSKEQGEADLNIHLVDEQVTVRNDKGEILMYGDAKQGLWDALWKQLGKYSDVSYRRT